MKFTRFLFPLFALFSITGIGQNLKESESETFQEYSHTTQSFGVDEGYFIKDYRSSLIDEDGTLWVSGLIENPLQNQFNEFYSSLLFFNGTKFQEFPFPHSLKKGSMKLIKGYNKEFFVLIDDNRKYTLISINPYSLEFKQIEIPKVEGAITHIKSFCFKNKFYISISTKSSSIIYTINYNWRIEKFEEFHLVKEYPTYFERIIGLEENIVLNDIHTGIYIIEGKSKEIKKLNSSDLGIKLSIEPKIMIHNFIKWRGTNFFKFNISSDYYFYNELSKKWMKANNTLFPFNLIKDNEAINDDGNSLNIHVEKLKGNHNLNFLDKKTNQIALSIPIREFSNNPKINSRNYNKEIFVFGQDKLMQVSFKKRMVKSFLEKYSIRAMLELPNNKVLIGTDFNGIKEINLDTGEENEFYGYLNQKKYSPNYACSFFMDSTGIYTHYNRSGICFIDNKSKKVTSYRLFPVVKFKNNGNSLFYITNGYKLMRFDKKSRTNIVIEETKELQMQDFVMSGDSIYAATSSGLFIYNNGKKGLINAPQGSNKLLCIVKHKKLGILIGTLDGKVLRYDQVNKSFSILYSDQFNSSIATILIDSQDDIWINSFKGFIRYSIKNNTIKRFGVLDGFTNNEANRYSSLRLKNGKFLIGTLKGLNYFDPSKLPDTEISSNLRFTGFEFYSENEIKKLVVSPQEIEATDKIILQPQNRNINLSFGFSDMTNTTESIRYKYRLNKGEWKVINEFGELFLSNLAPDNYSLEIAAINKIEEQIGNTISLTLIAEQFFYNKPEFWLLLSILIIVILALFTNQFLKNQELKQHFSDKIINAHLEEQETLSQKLHDSIGQKLLLAKNNFILHKNIPKEELSNLDEIIAEVRNISHDLHPIQFKELGFKKSVENIVDDFQRNSAIFYSHDVSCQKHLFAIEKELILFGIIQECLNNVEKHSNATACQVKVREKGKNLLIWIQDNGKGFDPAQKREKFSLGLKSMNEKIGYLGANSTLESQPGKGTKTIITIKLK